jgi:hypothetical protein
VDPNIDPLLASIPSTIGTGVATDLAAAGKTGVVINAMYDYWTLARQYQAYHGGARIPVEYNGQYRQPSRLRRTPDRHPVE